MSTERNAECFDSLTKKLMAFSAVQRDEFGEEIERITRANAAKGNLRSGSTIKEVARSMKLLLDNRAKLILSTIADLPFAYTETLGQAINEIADKYLPVDFSDFRMRYLDLVHLTNERPSVVDAALELADKNNLLIRSKLESEIHQHVLILKNKVAGNSSNNVFFMFEIFGAVLVAFLAGMWALDPPGNYEPWIALILAIIAGLDVARRFKQGKYKK